MYFYKNPIFFLFIFLSTLLFSACSSDNGKIPDPETPTPRTVLVYMVANNSLGYENDMFDLDEMEAARGDLGSSRWIVYHHGNDNKIELKELTPNGWKIIKAYTSAIKSTSSSRMSEVIKDMKQAAPAKSYGLVLWSHASGWVVDGNEDLVSKAVKQAKPLSFGSDNGESMNIATLRRVLDGEGFDYIYADCCNLATIEVAYELRDVSQYLVGSAAELPMDGMPYNLNLKLLAAANPDLTGAARNTYEHYLAQVDDGGWCTMSVIKLDEIEALASITKDIYQAARSYPASFYPQRLFYTYDSPYYYDFKHFVDNVATDATMLGKWNSQLDKTVLYQAYTPQYFKVFIEHHCGLATFVITSSRPASTKGYNTTSWYKDVAQYQPMQAKNENI